MRCVSSAERIKGEIFAQVVTGQEDGEKGEGWSERRGTLGSTVHDVNDVGGIDEASMRTDSSWESHW